MERNRKLVVSVLVAMVALLIGTLAIAQIVQANPSGQSESILGSWSAVVTVTAQPAPFPGLLTFTADGSLLTDEPPAPGETTGHGNWVRGSHGQVGYTFVALYGDSTGMYAGKLKLAGTLQRDAGKDTWSGPFKITIYDASDQVTFADNGTFKLTRIAVEPLD